MTETKNRMTESEIKVLRETLDRERDKQEIAYQHLTEKFADSMQYKRTGTVILEVTVKDGIIQKMRGRFDETLFDDKAGIDSAAQR